MDAGYAISIRGLFLFLPLMRLFRALNAALLCTFCEESFIVLILFETRFEDVGKKNTESSSKRLYRSFVKNCASSLVSITTIYTPLFFTVAAKVKDFEDPYTPFICIFFDVLSDINPTSSF